MAEMDDFNAKVIADFRANEGKVGPPFEGAPVLLLHHTGAKTGTERVNPLVYLPHDEDFVIFASKAGSPHDPHWLLNLQAHPETRVEVGSEVVDVTARVAEGEERDRLFNRQKELMPGFADYEAKTDGIRIIPVVVLERR